MKPIIFDIDGVLADFIYGFTSLASTMFGTAPYSTDEQVRWSDFAGLTKEATNEVWGVIKEDPQFWYSLRPLVPARTFETINTLPCDVYFVTNRSGVCALRQTQQWLEDNGVYRPMVVLSKYKGEIAKAIGAKATIEDKASNASCIAWLTEDKTRSYLLDRPYNRCDAGMLASSVVRIPSVDYFLKEVTDAAT